MQSTGDAALTRKHGTTLLILSVVVAIAALTCQYVLPISIVKYLIGAALACAAGVWVFAYPNYGLYLAVFYIYAGAGYYFDVHAGYPLVVIAAAAAAILVLRGAPLRLPGAAFNWAVALFTLFAVTSILWAHNPNASFLGISLWIKSAFLVYLVVQLLRTPRDVERMALVIFISAVAAVLLGLANLFFGWVDAEGPTAEYGWIRFSATHGDANQTAVLLASALPIGVYAMRRFRTWPMLLLLATTTLLLLLAAFSTLSRAAVFPLGFVVVVILARDLRHRALIAGVVAAVLIAVLVPPVYWERLLSLEQIMSGVIGDYSLLMRFKAMQSAWHLFLSHPLTGIGLENFSSRSGADVYVRIAAHNAALDLLCGVGFIGFGAYASMLVAAFGHFHDAMRATWEREAEWMRHLAFYVLVSVGAILVGAMFLSIWHVYILWLPVAIGLAAGRLARERLNGEDARRPAHDPPR